VGKRRIVWEQALPIALMLIGASWLLFGGTLRGMVYYGGDIARIYLPLRTALTSALLDGRLPWWTSKLGIGYPLVAAGEAGALYPPNWAVSLIWPPETSLTITVLLHYAWSALGMARLARDMQRSPWAASMAAAVWAWGGFNIAHASHVSILCTASWLPWMLLLARHVRGQELRPRRTGPLLLLGACIAMQFLAGHAQINALNLIVLTAYALWLNCDGPKGVRGALGVWPVALAMLLGCLLAAPQLVPSAELGLLSSRGGGLDASFFTSYSFHPALAVTWVSPFVLGNPYPDGSIELMVYAGLLPLLLASLTLWRGRGRERWFWVGLGLAGLLLALGRWNPLYDLLRHVPILNLFRVPARYLLWSHLALAVLAAQGVDWLIERGQPGEPWRGWLTLALVVVGAGVSLGAAYSAGEVDALVARWQWLPILLLVTSLSPLVLGRDLGRPWLGGLLLLVALCDLIAHQRVLAMTYSRMAPVSQVVAPLKVREHLEDAHGLCRLYTKEEIVPALSVQKASLYPNMGLWQGIASANVYMPLVPRSYQGYLEGLDAQRLNRMAVGYYAIPQLLPVDEASELYDVRNPLSALPTESWLSVALSDVERVEVESYLSHSADWQDGTLCATIWLATDDGELMLPIRAGLESAEWAYERDDVAEVIAHRMPEVASTWPARSGFPPRDHVGHTYYGRLALNGGDVSGVRIELAQPLAFCRIEDVRFALASGEVVSLANALGLGDHRIAYRSDDVLLYRNLDAMPRAYTVSVAMVERTGDTMSLPADLAVEDAGAVEMLGYEDMRVEMRASLSEPGYLVLADQFYPGWKAWVDGTPASILCADGVFRAVELSAGEHVVEMGYSPFR